ncbi:MAG: D-alanyl-D-alanine carboxypeptidase family protein [Christensenellales bacterium]|jgi:D-alanyl-D-alanine carboxypeptidase (penicillin-binding protein 5/6)
MRENKESKITSFRSRGFLKSGTTPRQNAVRIVFSAVMAIAFFVALLYNNGIAKAAVIEPSVQAQAAVMMEASSRRVLYQKNSHQRMPMASTTKIMTAIVAIENGNLQDTITVSENASGIEGSSIWLEVGERMTLSDMLYGLMLSSGNDAAVAIAEHIGGSVDGFIDMMNSKAIDIGAEDTVFMNPNGLHDDNHFTTAYDLALISCYAMENNVFAEIVSSQYKNISWEGHQWERSLRNKNKILWQYEGGNGVKTGYTKAAGRCLVSAALRDEMQIVTVALNCPDMFIQSMNLLDYGFDAYEMRTVFSRGQKLGRIDVEQGTGVSIEAVCEDDMKLPVKKEGEELDAIIELPDIIEAPVKKGDVIGSASVYINGGLLAQSRLYASEDIARLNWRYGFDMILNNWLRKAG